MSSEHALFSAALGLSVPWSITDIRSPALRLLFVGIALLLRNVWVRMHWHYLATPRRGDRKLHLDRLPFKTLLM